MTKRERERLNRKIDRMITAVGKKRDELRALLNEIGPLVDSLEDGIDSMGSAIHYMNEAREQLDYAVGQISQYA